MIPKWRPNGSRMAPKWCPKDSKSLWKWITWNSNRQKVIELTSKADKHNQTNGPTNPPATRAGVRRWHAMIRHMRLHARMQSEIRNTPDRRHRPQGLYNIEQICIGAWKPTYCLWYGERMAFSSLTKLVMEASHMAEIWHAAKYSTTNWNTSKFMPTARHIIWQWLKQLHLALIDCVSIDCQWFNRSSTVSRYNLVGELSRLICS